MSETSATKAEHGRGVVAGSVCSRREGPDSSNPLAMFLTEARVSMDPLKRPVIHLHQIQLARDPQIIQY